MSQTVSLEVHKLGGTSLASASHFKQIKNLVKNRAAIVVSATTGTTNSLQQLLTKAVQQESYLDELNALQAFHIALVDELIVDQDKKDDLIAGLKKDVESLHNLLQTTYLLSRYGSDVQDKVLGYGELWSAKILATFYQQFATTLLIDASKVLVTYQKENQLYINWKRSSLLLEALLAQHSFEYLVITGFIAMNEEGHFVTLGRNGSDYSAAIFAQLLHAENLVIWTDVDGIYSADPNRVRSAFPLPSLSYEEALELAYFGAKVIHPQTIFPAINHNIPIYVKNSADPDKPGTLISSKSEKSDFLVQGLSCIDNVGLINIEGSGITTVSGTAARVFQLMHSHDINVVLISQASSEHSICFAVKQDQILRAEKALDEHFYFEIEQHLIKRIRIDPNCAILAAVGDGMVGRRGVSGKLCMTLARANVNIKAIAQGSSERNLSVVVSHSDINKALRAVHSGFYLSRKTISIGLVGPGQVGQALLRQLQAAFSSLQRKHHVNLYVRGIIDSKKMLLNHHSIDLSNWQRQWVESAYSADLHQFIEHIDADDMPHAVIIDCTASQQIAECYPAWLKRGLHIVTPNKRANSSDFAFYQELQALTQKMNRFYLYETTVCAGLPVIKTLQDIIATGDDVESIQGIVSGTLSYIFNRLGEGDTFSTIVQQAKAAGYTEPDPRDDLSGKDVARKFVCLARELGYAVTLEDVSVTNLVPAALQTVSVSEFLERLPEFDEELQAKLAPIFAKQQQPCYVGCIDAKGHIEVAIAGFDRTHPFSRLSGTDNMLIFKTTRYHDQPLVIQGPGAGTEVTAAGIFSDLLRLVTALN